MATFSVAEAEALVTAALIASRVRPDNAIPTARALVAAEVDGQPGHGLMRVPSYAAQARTGKVDGFATPTVTQVKPGLIHVDAAHGFAYPALELAIHALPAMARGQGIAAAMVRRSHHFGQAGAHCERLAEAGCAAFLFGNSPAAMAPWGAQRALLGTNPIAFAAPVVDRPPLVIDMAMSRQARGKIVAAEREGRPIPADWAFGPDGAPTTDPAAALAGTLAPIADAKGAALAMMVEVMAACLTGANLAFEATSMFEQEGEPPAIGQALIAIDVEAASGGAFSDRMALLLKAYVDEGVRLPGDRRLERRRIAAEQGIEVNDKLKAEIKALAADSTTSDG